MMRIEDSSDHSKDSDFQNAEDKHVEAGKTIGNDGQHAEAIDEIGGSITVPLSILPSSEGEIFRRPGHLKILYSSNNIGIILYHQPRP